MTDYTWADGVEGIVKDLIATVEEHQDLANAQVLCVFRDKAATSRGRTVLGKARHIGGLTRFLITEVTSPLFVLEIAANTWETLTDEQRRALVDHELSHLRIEQDDDGHWIGGTRGHDLEEFVAVVERHGLWKADVAALGTIAATKLEQLTLELVDDPSAADPNNKGGRP